MSGETQLMRLENASRTFQMGEVAVNALIEAKLTIESGEFVVIIGPSGSGKSTLLNLIGGTDRPTSGAVWYGDANLAIMTDKQLTEYRRESVGFIFQFYNLVPSLTAYENVQAAAELVDDPMDPAEALKLVDLADRTKHFPSQLSGGEQQRVAIARALAKRPKLLLADEPTGALDLPTAQNVLGVLRRLNRDQELTVVLITHNQAIAAMADRVVRIVSGKITEATANENPVEASEVHW
jgi:putative ABC transport system ATP-binding protein